MSTSTNFKVSASAQEPWPLARMTSGLKGYIANLGAVWVEGELVEWKLNRGSVYGKLKDLDQDVTVSINLWRNVVDGLDQDFAAGDRVVALVKANFWEVRGTLSMNVLDIRPAGLGMFLEKIEKLRKQLAAEGLFDPARKRALPFLPSLIGLITGPDSDAEKDVLRNSERRWPDVQFRTVHTAVQGDRVAAEVSAAIAKLDADPEVDVIIIARGGGDLQHLIGFSDEQVVRAAAAATTPIVSAIGHENDHPLLDEVADLRASTPTDAAKRVVPDVIQELQIIQEARTRIDDAMLRTIQIETQQLSALVTRPALATTTWMFDQRSDDISRLALQLDQQIDRQLERTGMYIDKLAVRLEALSPTHTLARGYSITLTPDGSALRDPTQAPAGTALKIFAQSGIIDATSLGAENTKESTDTHD